MTTLIGIKADEGVEGIVLAADTQINIENGEDREKNRSRKIIVTPTWAMAVTGVIKQRYYSFAREFRPRKKGRTEEQIREVIATAVRSYDEGPKYPKPHFMEVNTLNTLLSREGVDSSDLTEFVLAANYPRLSLWTVDVMGNLKPPADDTEFEYVSLGSGSDKAIGYIEQQMRGEIDPNAVTIPVAIDLAVGALHAAEKDAYTGGLDLVIVTKEKVTSYGDMLREAAARAEKGAVEAIQREYGSG